MRIRLIIRPRDRMPWMDEVRSEVASLRDAGHDVAPRLTFEAGDATRFAREAAEAGVDLLIAAGGDGTVNEVVNGVAEAEWGGRLAVIPLGTANDFALGLGIPEEVPEAFATAVSGRDRTIDLARVNDRWFVNVSTGGVAATATGDAPKGTKRLLGPLAYLLSGIQKLPELAPKPARFSTPDGERYEGEVMMFAVGNGHRTGAGSLLTPNAELDDGQLDVMIVSGMRWVDFVAMAPRIRSGDHLDDARVTHFRTDRLEVECDEEVAVNADGEPMKAGDYRYEIIGEALTVRVPSS